MTHLFDLAGDALALDPALFRAATDASLVDEGLKLLLLAGLSLALGQALALFLSRVPPRRFALALAMNALLFSASVLAWALSIYAATRLIGVETSPVILISLVALAHAPYLLAFFAVIPHFGLLWLKLLEAWVLVGIVMALAVGLGLPLIHAGAIGLAGWALTRAFNFVAGPFLARLTGGLRRFAAGREIVGPHDVVAALKAQAAGRIGPP